MILCKALLKKPRVLWIDNPHIGLDQEGRSELNELLDELMADSETTFILIRAYGRITEPILHIRCGWIMEE